MTKHQMRYVAVSFGILAALNVAIFAFIMWSYSSGAYWNVAYMGR
jgi:hypothetical protein